MHESKSNRAVWPNYLVFQENNHTNKWSNGNLSWICKEFFGEVCKLKLTVRSLAVLSISIGMLMRIVEMENINPQIDCDGRYIDIIIVWQSFGEGFEHDLTTS